MPPAAAPAGAAPTQTQQAVAPAAHAAAPRPAPVPLEPEALGLSIARHAAEGEDVFEISLSPDELGRIDIRLHIAEDGKVSAHIQAERPETLGLLQRDRAELARVLGGQGLNADPSTLNFTLRDGEGGNQGQQAGDGQHQARRQRSRLGAGGGLAALDTVTPRPPAGTRSRAIDIAV
ncbi:flagellar hook-length control protein FliK [Zavarzinia compransoris]|nr:flagellar hook-length control protein FliK [Zavarzinia compransoris]